MKISGYTIRRRLGTGGQALVYLAIQESLERPVALKVLHPLHAESPEFTSRFLNEGRILANLGHSNVITIHDIGVEGEYHYLSMELVEGGDLKRRMRSGLAPETVIEYLTIIADCLATAHDKHIVHRDIKPGNVLFRRDGTLLLTDFGIAKQLDTGGDLTLSGTTLGSPHYLSPEQAQGLPLDGRADIYSLGAMAYEMLAGEKPYAGDSEIQAIFKHINAPVPRLPDHLTCYQELIDRTMAKSPDDRFESARQVVSYLRELDAGAATRRADGGAKRAATAPAAQRPGKEDPTEVFIPAGAQPARRGGVRPSLALMGLAVVLLVSAWITFRVEVERTDSGGGPELAVADSAQPPAAVASAPPAGAAAADGAARTSDSTTTTRARADRLAISALERIVAPAPAAAHWAGPSWSSAPPHPVGDRVPEEAAAGPAPAAPDAATQVRALLAEAEAALFDLRLTRPVNHSALAYYQRVLAIDPRNREAREGYRRIADRYATLALAALERENVTGARSYVERGLELDGEHFELLELRARIERTGRYAPRIASAEPAEPQPTPADAGEIQGESPRQLLRRIKSWFQ